MTSLAPCSSAVGQWVWSVDAFALPVRAARQAGAVAHALVAPAIVARGDGVGPRPPMPAQLVHALGGLHADAADRHGRQRIVAVRRVGRIPRQPGNTHLVIHPGVVGLQVLIGEGPVVGHAVEGLHAEVRRHEALPVRRVEDRRAAHRAVHQRVDIACRGVDRIVGFEIPDIRVGVPALLRHELPFGLVAVELGVVHPWTLFQAHDIDAGNREVCRRDGARRTGPDDEHIGRVAALLHLRHSHSLRSGTARLS